MENITDKQKELLEYVASVGNLHKHLRKVHNHAVHVSAEGVTGIEPEMCGNLCFVSELADLLEETVTDKARQKELLNWVDAVENLHKHLRKVHNYAVHISAEGETGIESGMCGNLSFVSELADLLEEVVTDKN